MKIGRPVGDKGVCTQIKVQQLSDVRFIEEVVREAAGKLQRFSVGARLTSHVRHRSKYLNAPMQCGHEFVFTANGKPVGRPSRTLQEFVSSLESVSRDALDGHAHRGDFSRWIAEGFHDHPLASDVRKVEQRYRLGYVEILQGELIKDDSGPV